MKKILPALLTLCLGLSIIPLVFADSGDLALTSDNVYLSDTTIVHNQAVRIYATVKNNSSNQDLLGSVQFKNQTTGHQIGNDQPISVRGGGTDTVFVDWRPMAGTYTIVTTVYPWDTAGDDSANNQISFAVTVDYDYDNDGVGNAQDPDDDNDGVADKEDLFPLDKNESQDTDQDGLGNNADLDDDNDGTLDEVDALPQDANEFVDTDEDGTGNNTDFDDDNDGLSDVYEQSTTDPNSGEAKPSTNPLLADTDTDGYNDQVDTFPSDSTEWEDTDHDNIGDNTDFDDDGDGLADLEDDYPKNHGPVITVERYEETDPATLEKFLILDASKSSDPDGSAERLKFQWFTKEGRLIGEEAIFKLAIPFKNILPSTLMVFDENGESRTFNLSLTGKGYLKIMGGALSISLLLTLALIIYLKYTASARSDKKSSKPKKK
ncbi:MAG: ATPase [Candidatus Peregrinibacteria bacterium GW2011_GWF2_39_17]|nr:MAG: ATPase [Candidatus Peregrinibacteria bacterium GW2011_GWF2_39_17]HCW32007.1 hypothetical protein [Candidatus Peregrinibacteria bacterium]